jgi:hypothetical protein
VAVLPSSGPLLAHRLADLAAAELGEPVLLRTEPPLEGSAPRPVLLGVERGGLLRAVGAVAVKRYGLCAWFLYERDGAAVLQSPRSLADGPAMVAEIVGAVRAARFDVLNVLDTGLWLVDVLREEIAATEGRWIVDIVPYGDRANVHVVLERRGCDRFVLATMEHAPCGVLVTTAPAEMRGHRPTYDSPTRAALHATRAEIVASVRSALQGDAAYRAGPRPFEVAVRRIVDHLESAPGDPIRPRFHRTGGAHPEEWPTGQLEFCGGADVGDVARIEESHAGVTISVAERTYTVADQEALAAALPAIEAAVRAVAARLSVGKLRVGGLYDVIAPFQAGGREVTAGARLRYLGRETVPTLYHDFSDLSVFALDPPEEGQVGLDDWEDREVVARLHELLAERG